MRLTGDPTGAAHDAAPVGFSPVGIDVSWPKRSPMARATAMCHHSPMVAPVARSLATDPDLERRLVEEVKRLLAAARGEAEGARVGGPMPRAPPGAGHGGRGIPGAGPALRRSAGAGQPTRHLHEYFGEEGFPLPPLVAFGVRHVQAGIATPFVARAIRKSLGGLARRFLG
ncbi:MAG: hypothetical protein ACREYC_26530, partial [Gammaproteobacteria bacterium]